MNKLLKTILISIFITVVVASLAISKPFYIFGKKDPDTYFIVDYAAFKSDTSDLVRLELYYQIYNASLNFSKDNSTFKAEYEISIKIYDDHNDIVGSYSKRKKIKVFSKDKALSFYDYRTNQKDFELEPGKYEVKFTLSDPNSKYVKVRNLKLKLKDFNRKSSHLSDVELVQAVKASDEKLSIFDKGDFTLVPSVTHEYGNDDNFRLLFYMEIYQGENISESVRVETVLRHSLKGMVYRDSLTTKLNDGITRQFRDISLENLYPGEYELIVTLRGRRNKKVAEKHRDFSLVWSQKTLLKYDYKSVIGQLELIAEKSDIEILKKSKTFEEKLSAIDAFWLARDPTPGTEENEAQKQFYHRIYIANQNFSYLYQTGWKTDRGRIYIMYGEPDQIDDYPIVPNQRPYQEWHYYQGTRYRKFVFVDYNEDGDYRLQYPYDGLNVRPDF